jgi:hypothetical protein
MVEPTLGEEILYVSITECEAQVEPHSMLEDNRRKAVAAIESACPATSLPEPAACPEKTRV